jgi:hypothetical protein
MKRNDLSTIQRNTLQDLTQSEDGYTQLVDRVFAHDFENVYTTGTKLSFKFEGCRRYNFCSIDCHVPGSGLYRVMLARYSKDVYGRVSVKFKTGIKDATAEDLKPYFEWMTKLSLSGEPTFTGTTY